MPVVERGLLVVFTAFVAGGILARLFTLRQGWDKLTKRAVQRASNILVGMGLLGLMLYFFTYERIYVLSLRFGYLLWLVLFIWNAYRLYRYVRVEIPTMERRRAERDQINKWLPKSK